MMSTSLFDVATGKTPHLYAGRCPDSVNGPEPRDPDCPACQAIAAAEAQQERLLQDMHDAGREVDRVMAEPQPDAGLIGVQWWLAELDLYGNPALADGAHSDRAGADKAMYLFKALHLDAGRRFAVARVELSEPKPRGDGVNHEAIKTLNDARREAQP